MTEPLFLDVRMRDRQPDGGMSPDDMEARLSAALIGAFPDAEAPTSELVATFASILRGDSAVLALRPSLAAPDRAAAKTLLEQLVRLSGTVEATRREAAIADLSRIILPDPLAEARAVIAADNLEFRDRVLAEIPALTGVQVGEQAGHGSRNPYATAARWKRGGAIFSVTHRGAEWFPAFQFRDGAPHPTIKKVLATLPPMLSPWQRLAWFVSTNGWLDDREPQACLDETDGVLAAAAREADEVIG